MGEYMGLELLLGFFFGDNAHQVLVALLGVVKLGF
jgi:hypothetical protein